MLEFSNIVKDYKIAETYIRAVNGVSLKFRESEFVSILGPSGCGKTTMLNIIGGLDRYTSGDLVIRGVSTKKFRDRDWDTYRNHSVGFVFQNYNLIPHQSVLSNVELALTLSGVSKKERREKAKRALEKVGLADQINKRPSQMSGGQMQRVAIARALVNDPDILLADEPTGALDTQTSIQVLALLKEVAQDKLVIMVTHNSELAERYSTRIIKLRDGQVISDSNPYDGAAAPDLKKEREQKSPQAVKKTSMSFLTALSLSLNNLLTKKGRTILTSFAGSMGIIGIALILALSNGIQGYIDKVQEDTLSTYPLSVQQSTQDYTAMLEALAKVSEVEDYSDTDKIHVEDSMGTMMAAMYAKTTNNLTAFKKHIEDNRDKFSPYVSDIQYIYDMKLQIFSQDGKTQVNPTTIFEKLGGQYAGMGSMEDTGAMGGSSMSVISQMIDNDTLLSEQYDVIAGRMPDAWNEIVLVVDNNNQISKITLYMLGMLDQDEFEADMKKLRETGEYESADIEPFEYEDFLKLSFNMLLASDYYRKTTNNFYSVDGETYPVWSDRREDPNYDQIAFSQENGVPLKVVGILRPDKDAAATSITTPLAYTKKLSAKVLEMTAQQDIIMQQRQTPGINVLTGMPFETIDRITRENFAQIIDKLPQQTLNVLLLMAGQTIGQEVDKQQFIEYVSVLPDKEFNENADAMLLLLKAGQTTYEKVLSTLGGAEEMTPYSVNFYAKDFDSKDTIKAFISEYNDGAEEADKVKYNDLMGVVMSSITLIISIISYVLIAFVSISLAVSSIMIGIITYISVLERTKEIGILRAMGASKKDISRVFNAETLIVGLAAGVFGIVSTLVLILPINAVIHALSGIGSVGAKLPVIGAAALIVISMFLTWIAGLIPSKIASKKDPVEALRSE